MKRFLTHTLVFILVLLIVFSILDLLVSAGLRRSGHDDFAEWEDIVRGQVDADLVVQGSSRAFVHVSPAIVDTLMDLKSYNLGMDGYNFFMQRCRWDMYRKFNRKPKYVVQIVGNYTLDKRSDLYEYQQFFPYLHDPVIRKGTRHYEGLNFADYFIPFMRYFSQSDYVALGLRSLLKQGPRSSRKYKGYLGRDRVWDGTFDEFKKTYPDGFILNFNPEIVDLFDTWLAECRAEGVVVFLVYAPEYIEVQSMMRNRDEMIALYQGLSGKHGFTLLDYSGHPISHEKEYFYNSQHLNRRGAERFTTDMVHRIMEMVSVSMD